MSAELFTNDFAVSEIVRSAPVLPHHPELRSKLSLELEIVPPPPEERLAAAIATGATYYETRTAQIKEIGQEPDRTTLRVDVLSHHEHMLNNYASSFGDKLAAVLNARPEAVLRVVNRLMDGEIIQDSPLAERRRKKRD